MWKLGTADIQARQSLPTRLVHAGGMGCADQANGLGAHGLKSWIEAVKKRLHHNVFAIALANKLARIAWSVWLVVDPSRFERSMRAQPNLPDFYSTPTATGTAVVWRWTLAPVIAVSDTACHRS
jgi:hypothetical protein